ncbi:SIR2 family NAD-dependent protein deacylase [Paraburkholderia silvatlantica]|uniref:protein acetyllysine N-acetyltransferase n=1 Tax=Paraburkholderia silvatlantica TaxID=321895 RepID=A0ABR6FNM4_9BURK|nr:Sir2 family NAD-dependent protein deacetylase [Paraburkholderia silvatlantica]MBB2929018.1 NAD-dependent SIR2 family protein deacetylase [Paraburkholderia silvatlantica]PVY29114.1 NAD-dependent SIR2 family protein deacetylase [Paraburkholderia silvatlantica]PXW36589.1 NAD-dependent SIR2 family protein deacetylase [Paraburkholderia silvatlantica]TDQ98977.1 NAD-dependent SIR2 family protein deacetylase [Paraburkholderia silvatlantica]
MESDIAIRLAADWIRDADGLLITAGAGMGVDSGLPDFRGTEGFWRAYPALRHHGFSFEDIANPSGFASNPRLSWGFYGHRLALYRATVPHAGFGILLKWASAMQHGAFVFTSNVDGQFQKAGFDVERIMECHGTIHRLQCVEACTDNTWPADDFSPVVNESSCLLENEMPRCPHCGGLARPNILMFGDWGWISRYVDRQEEQLNVWLKSVENLAVFELGAGQAVPTVRRFSERNGPRVIRINPREPAISSKAGVGIAFSALDALQRVDEYLGETDDSSPEE